MKRLGLQEKLVTAIIAVLTVCCVLGMFSGFKILWMEPEPSVGGRHTRNLITAADYTHVFMIVKRQEIGGAIAAIHSITRNTKSPVHFNLVTDNNTMNYLWLWIEHSSALKEISYEIKGVTKQWMESQVGITGNITQLLPYCSIFLHKLFPYLKGNVIVLENDLILQGDIAELRNLTIGKHSVAAFASNCDSLGTGHLKVSQNLYASFVDVRKRHFQDLHLNASACTFASGIYVVNIDAWKREDISKHILHWIHLNQKENLYKGEGPLPAFMIALFGKVSTLDPLWNVRNLGLVPGSRDGVKFLSKAKLLHWNGPFKPWKRQSQYQSLWDKYFLADPTGRFVPVRKVSNNLSLQ